MKGLEVLGRKLEESNGHFTVMKHGETFQVEVVLENGNDFEAEGNTLEEAVSNALKLFV